MDLKDDHWEELYLYAKQLADHKSTYEEIENQLSKKTDDHALIREIILQIKKVKCSLRRKNGLSKVGLGATLLFSGFLVTCINFHSDQSFATIMYTTSTIGLILVFWGFYDIVG